MGRFWLRRWAKASGQRKRHGCIPNSLGFDIYDQLTVQLRKKNRYFLWKQYLKYGQLLNPGLWNHVLKHKEDWWIFCFSVRVVCHALCYKNDAGVMILSVQLKYTTTCRWMQLHPIYRSLTFKSINTIRKKDSFGSIWKVQICILLFKLSSLYTYIQVFLILEFVIDKFCCSSVC